MLLHYLVITKHEFCSADSLSPHTAQAPAWRGVRSNGVQPGPARSSLEQLRSFSNVTMSSVQSLHDHRHAAPVRQLGLLAQPQAVLDGERVDGDGEALGVDLGELLAAGVVLEVLVEHVFSDLLGPRAVDLEHLLGVGVVGVQAAELALGVPEQHEEVGTVARVDLVHDALPDVLVDGAGEDGVLQRVHHDGAVGL